MTIQIVNLKIKQGIDMFFFNLSQSLYNLDCLPILMPITPREHKGHPGHTYRFLDCQILPLGAN